MAAVPPAAARRRRSKRSFQAGRRLNKRANGSGRAQRQALAAFQRLVQGHEGRGEYGRACKVAWRWIELAPWQEEAHRALMHLLALSGQRSVALAQYESCRHTLSEELGVEPEEETTALYQRIRDGSLRTGETPPQSLIPASR